MAKARLRRRKHDERDHDRAPHGITETRKHALCDDLPVFLNT